MLLRHIRQIEGRIFYGHYSGVCIYTHTMCVCVKSNSYSPNMSECLKISLLLIFLQKLDTLQENTGPWDDKIGLLESTNADLMTVKVSIINIAVRYNVTWWCSWSAKVILMIHNTAKRENNVGEKMTSLPLKTWVSLYSIFQLLMIVSELHILKSESIFCWVNDSSAMYYTAFWRIYTRSIYTVYRTVAPFLHIHILRNTQTLVFVLVWGAPGSTNNWWRILFLLCDARDVLWNILPSATYFTPMLYIAVPPHPHFE